MNGIIYVAYGEKARLEAKQSIQSLNNQYPVTLIGDKRIDGVKYIPIPQLDAGGRWAKLNIDTISPYDSTLYLDADTRIRTDLSLGFDILSDGWDMVIVPSKRQGNDLLGNCSLEDRNFTYEKIGTKDLLGLQAGVFWFAKNKTMMDFFSVWRDEWRVFRTMDQSALLRALWRVPIKVWLLSHEWNGGSLIEHLFGRAKA